MKKKVISTLLAFVIILAFIGVYVLPIVAVIAKCDDSASKKRIFSFVTKHQDELVKCIEEKDYSSLEKYFIIKGIDEYEQQTDFYCGGRGLGAESYYCGFYYSANDVLDGVWCAPKDDLEPKGKGYYWHEDVGDNDYYVEHICGHFYFYEAGF